MSCLHLLFPHARRFALLLAVAAGSAAAADTTIQRCEGTDGRITYSNGSCPSNTRQQRTIEYTPSLEVGRPKTDEAAGSGANEAAEANKDKGKAEKAADKAKEKAKAAAGVVKSRPAKPNPAAGTTPDQAREAEAEKRKAQLGVCDDLVHRIEFAQRDYDAAPAGERASAELALRRLQAEHTEQCEPRKPDGAKKASS